jgi:hypothetical protein
MTAREWDGVPCDDPAERVGEPYVEAEDNGPDWADLTSVERAARAHRALRGPVDRDGWPAGRQP